MKNKSTKIMSLIAVIAAVIAVIIALHDDNSPPSSTIQPPASKKIIHSEPSSVTDSKQVEEDHGNTATRAQLPTMLELGSEGCIPCERMRPVMEQLRSEYGDRIEVIFHDVRKGREIAEKYRIRLIPTQIFLKEDGTEFFRHEGFFPKTEIEKVFRDMGVQL